MRTVFFQWADMVNFGSINDERRPGARRLDFFFTSPLSSPTVSPSSTSPSIVPSGSSLLSSAALLVLTGKAAFCFFIAAICFFSCRICAVSTVAELVFCTNLHLFANVSELIVSELFEDAGLTLTNMSVFAFPPRESAMS